MSAQLSADKPTIKILLYTDDPQISQSNDLGEFLGLGSMIERLHQHAPAFADLKTKWVSRSSDHPFDNKLNVVLARELETGQPFDEIWFFGLHQANREKFSLGAFRGGQYSELDATEVAALQQWMSTADAFQGGGILMTGDHANATPSKLIASPDSPCGDTAIGAKFLGLGRAIGRCVPRAGLLRKWEGPPTFEEKDSFSTIANSGYQLDDVPQELRLRPVNLDGDPDSNGQPHPLFFYKPGKFIKSFPDHAHEGAVIIPEDFDGEVWPSGPKGQTRPHVVAFGRDKRRDDELNLVATYNGDLASVGRIVAHSTWHHYMNLNLSGFPHPGPIGSISDQIGQFYANLAIWLAPRSKRSQMARAMCWRLAEYTLLLEGRADPESIGDLANSVLSKVASPCEIHELLQVLSPMEHGGLPAAATAGDSDEPSRELFLGVVLDAYHEVMVKDDDEDLTHVDGAAAAGPDELIELAFRRTFDEQEKRFRRKIEAVNNARIEHN